MQLFKRYYKLFLGILALAILFFIAASLLTAIFIDNDLDNQERNAATEGTVSAGADSVEQQEELQNNP